MTFKYRCTDARTGESDYELTDGDKFIGTVTQTATGYDLNWRGEHDLSWCELVERFGIDDVIQPNEPVWVE